MMVTDLRCWWQNHHVGDFFHYVGDFSNVLNRSSTSSIGHRHLKLVTNTFGLQHPTYNLAKVILMLVTDVELNEVTNLTVTDQLWPPTGLTLIKSFSSDVLEVARPIDNRYEVQNHSSNSVSFRLKLLFIVAVGIEKCRYKYNAILYRLFISRLSSFTCISHYVAVRLSYFEIYTYADSGFSE